MKTLIGPIIIGGKETPKEILGNTKFPFTAKGMRTTKNPEAIPETMRKILQPEFLPGKCDPTPAQLPDHNPSDDQRCDAPLTLTKELLHSSSSLFQPEKPKKSSGRKGKGKSDVE